MCSWESGQPVVLLGFSTHGRQKVKSFLFFSAAGEGREKRLADIEKCERGVQDLLQQATAVPLTLVRSTAETHTTLLSMSSS